MEREYLFIGGIPDGGDQHPGGQVTASRNLLQYAKQKDIVIRTIDTSQSSFPIPPLSSRLKKAAKRLLLLLRMLLRSSTTFQGAIVFSSAGFSFYEKSLMCLLLKLFRVKVIIFVRSGHFMTRNQSGYWRRRLIKALLKLPDYIGAQGEKWVQFYQELGVSNKKVQSILNWCDLSELPAHAPTSTSSGVVTFLYVGWLVEKKGLHDLFEVIERCKGNSNIRFLVVGGGDLYEPLQQKCIADSLSYVTMTGWIEHEQLSQYFKQADAFILPSHAEGFPNVLLEAMTYKLPIIATDVGGISDSVIDDYNGYLVKPKDRQALYEKVVALSQSESLRKQFSDNAEKLLFKNHDMEKNCKALFLLLGS